MKGYLKKQPDNGLDAHELTLEVTRIGGDNDNDNDLVIKVGCGSLINLVKQVDWGRLINLVIQIY